MKKDTKLANRNAPRYRTERMELLTMKLHEKFMEKFPEHKTTSFDLFKTIVTTFNKNLYLGAIDNRDGVELPEGLGHIFIGTCQPPKRSIDYASSFKYNTEIRYRNFETDGHLGKIFYTSFAGKYRFKDREIWKFKGHRDFTQAVSKAYLKNWKKYVEVDNFQKISKLYVKHLKKDHCKRYHKPITEDYNEFEIN